MKTLIPATKRSKMSPDAYAGFLKLWLTPAERTPRLTSEVRAYLRHVEEREPLSREARRALGHTTDRAA